MGDHRLSVEISLVGSDGEERKYSLWKNWSDEILTDVFKMVIEAADESQLSYDLPDDQEIYDIFYCSE